MERFNKACLEIQDLPTEVVIMGLVNGLRDDPFSQSLSKRHPASLRDVQERAEKYINMEENARLREPSWRSGHLQQPKEKEREPKRKEEVRPEKPRRYHTYTLLRVFLVDVYREICHTEKLPPLRPIKNKKGRSRNEYCEYHKLKRDEENHEQRDPPPRTPERHIHMISGGFAGGGLTKSSQMRHLKEVYQVGDNRPDLPTISFTREDEQGIIPGHDDPVLGLEEKELKAYLDTLFGLGDAPIKPLGFIPLYTTFGKGLRSKTLNINFIVVDVSSTYNALIGRATLNRLGAVVSTPHLCIKFPTKDGIATIRGDQKLARKCYNESLNLQGKGKEVNAIKLGGV
ncbi:uncharacterized protein LOC107633005 [Arachis ipaensis]|uniref:uncharacterized protein LOC107633005 n=1 Tax=Arachis ipaensis TaxID=130454 RepID=UPI0007AF2B94|nr:uncharacterized protein LOC107633005 [Arachis ipaensis]XP_025638638.1 uncharacterized protein LOC112733769 [Arachis hypogaea]